MTADKVLLLSKVEYFSELTTEELTELAENFYWEEYAQGADIITKGQEQKGFYALVEGKAKVLDSGQGIEEISINIYGPGDGFGARTIVTGIPAPDTVRCLENCKVLVVSAEQFINMLLRWPKLYKKLIEKLSETLDQVNHELWEARHKEFLHTILQHTKYENKFYGLWGSPKTTKMMENKLAELAQSKENLLLMGERGTGRQMLTWHLHKRRFGESAPFVVVEGHELEKQWDNRIFESKGLRKGSFFEYVAGGTLYIEEIDQLSHQTQLKLVKVLRLHEKKFVVVGSIKDDSKLLALVPELRRLFSDLFKIAPLRERKRDIPFIAQGILEKLAKQQNRQTPSLDSEATKLLLSHNYGQGNVTELIQVIERAFFLTEHDVIRLEHVFFGPTVKKIGGTFDLLSFSLVKKLIEKGVFVLWMQRITAIVFISIILLMFLEPKIIIATGLFALVWGLWWPALAMLSPFLGRVWCTVCPFSYVMDIVQKKVCFDRPVPDVIKKYNYLLITFLFLLIFWIEVIFYMRSSPGYTGILLATILGAAVLTGIIYTRHAWCHHLCPLGGFVGMASIGAMLEVRADATVCLNKCTTYDCYKGSAAVAGCPMSQYAPFVDNGLVCKMCFNCVRNCKNGAVKFNIRIPAREVWHLLRVNQGFVVFIGVSLAILFPINYFEPLRQSWPTGKWELGFSIYYWGVAILAGVLTWLIARPYQTKAASKRIKLIFSCIPAVIAGHIIYQLNYLPGADSILLGLGYKTAAGDISTVDILATRAGQLLAALIGLILTGFTFMMVMLRSRGKLSDNALKPDGARLVDQAKKIGVN